MKRSAFWCAGAMLLIGMALAPQLADAAPRGIYGSAMGQARSVECSSQMRNLGQYLMMGGDRLPVSDKYFTDNGCPAKLLVCPGSGEKYKFLVSGRVRRTGAKVAILRCPTHGIVLYSDGSCGTDK